MFGPIVGVYSLKLATDEVHRGLCEHLVAELYGGGRRSVERCGAEAALFYDCLVPHLAVLKMPLASQAVFSAIIGEANRRDGDGEEGSSTAVPSSEQAAFTSDAVRITKTERGADNLRGIVDGDGRGTSASCVAPSPLPMINELLLSPYATNPHRGDDDDDHAVRRCRLDEVRLSHAVTRTAATKVPAWASGRGNLASASSSIRSLTLLGAFWLDSLTADDAFRAAPEGSRDDEDEEDECFYQQQRPSSSCIETLDVTFNNINIRFPNGMTSLRKVFFEYCDGLEDFDGLADSRQLEEVFIGACQAFRRLPCGLSFMKKLTLNWCTAADDISALSHSEKEEEEEEGNEERPSAVTSRRRGKGDYGNYSGSASSCFSVPPPPLAVLIINHNHRIAALPPRMRLLTTITLDKCDGLTTLDPALSGLPLLESIKVLSCPQLEALPHWWAAPRVKEGTGTRPTSSEEKGLLPCRLKRLTLHETRVGGESLWRCLASAAACIETIDISYNLSIQRLGGGCSDAEKEGDGGSRKSNGEMSPSAAIFFFPRLISFSAIGCPSLTAIDALLSGSGGGDGGSSSSRVPLLETLNMSECSSLSSLAALPSQRVVREKEVLTGNGGGQGGGWEAMFPSLTHLDLSWCAALPPLAIADLLTPTRTAAAGDGSQHTYSCGSHCPLLRHLNVSGCYQLTRLLNPTAVNDDHQHQHHHRCAGACPHLEKLVLEDCSGLSDREEHSSEVYRRGGGGGPETYKYLRGDQFLIASRLCYVEEHEEAEEDEEDMENEEEQPRHRTLTAVNFPQLAELNIAGCDEELLQLDEGLKQQLSRLIS